MTATAEAPAQAESKPKVTFWEGQPSKEQREPATVTEEVLVERRRRVSGTGTVTSVVLIPAKEGEDLAPFRAKCEHGKSDRKRHSQWSPALASAKASQNWCDKCREGYGAKHGEPEAQAEEPQEAGGEDADVEDRPQAEEQQEPVAP